MRTATIRNLGLVTVLGTLGLSCGAPENTPDADGAEHPKFMLVVHGGAGTIRKANMSPGQEAAYRAGMTRAIRAGYEVLNGGGTSLDAVQAAINVLEDDSLFNAGRGAVFSNAGTHELDAAIMDGSNLHAGAVAGVQHIRNPIDLARLVMEKSRHVLMYGAGAEEFATEQGMALVPQSYFSTQGRRDELTREQADEAKAAATRTKQLERTDELHSTVGAAALDSHGNLAAGTSTGGLTNKRYGRIGDSPIIGAGTYANNDCAAISATGTGEFFMRNVVAFQICARMMFKGESLAEAADAVVMKTLLAQQGDGGIIAVDRKGHVSMVFNTEGMYRGWVGPDGKITVEIYR
jgi:L-asparaginase / beta-aspartyl-peptidase